MLPTKYRLQKSVDFQKVFKNSRPIRLPNLAFKVFKNPKLVNEGETNLRFGFIVSNKIDKRATRRNALKRQLRQVASDLISELNTGYDILIVVHKDFPYPYVQEDIKKQFLEGMRRAGILNKFKI